MLEWLFNPARGRTWLHFILRWFILVGFTAAIVMQRIPYQPFIMPPFERFQDLLIPIGAGVLANIILGFFGAVKFLRPYNVYVKLPGDWLIVGLFAYASEGNLMLVTGIVLVMIAGGVLRLGFSEGLVQAVGVVVAAGIGLMAVPEVQLNINQNPLPLVSGVIFAVLLVIVAGSWAYLLNEKNSPRWRAIKKDVDEKNKRLLGMQESARAFSEMAASLNSTLEYDKILETALDIGRLSLRHDPKKRTVAMALMVDDDETLEIAAHRGLSHMDMTRVFPGREGIIGRVMTTGEVAIQQQDHHQLLEDDASLVEVAGVGELDPELKIYVSFRGIHSLLCIPLRADYTTYGVLLFGSSESNAFIADNIEILKSIGVQVTVALKNSVLYTSLQEEKKRLIELERNARQSLTRDLHDTVTQTVSAIKMRLSSLPMIMERYPDRFSDEVREMEDMAGRAVEEMRHVMFTLRPLVLENQGLSAAVDELKDRMIRTHKQKMETKMDYSVEPYLSLEQQEMLFYLIEEATNNTRKYAEAKKIMVQMTHEDLDCVVRVIDDGKGFDVDKMRRGRGGSFGMVNMQDRAALIGGALEIDSAPGKGTRITVRVPIGVRAQPKADGMTFTPVAQPQDGKGRQRIKRERTGPLSPST